MHMKVHSKFIVVYKSLNNATFTRNILVLIRLFFYNAQEVKFCAVLKSISLFSLKKSLYYLRIKYHDLSSNI